MILLSMALAQAAATTTPTTPAPSVAAVPTPPGSLQAAFNEATAAYAAQDWAKAIILFNALEARLGAKTSPTVRATIALRRGVALSRSGDDAAASTALRNAIANIPVDDSIMGPERREAQFELVRLLIRRSELASAAARIADLRADAKTPEDRFTVATLGLRATMFDPGSVPVAYASEMAAAATALPGIDKRRLAEIDTLRARLLLNRGQNAEGYALLKKALMRQGGLDTRVSLAEVATRSDLAIAALLNRDPDAAREYLAFTGQGRIQQSPFGSASAMYSPPCGGDAGLAPDDMAIVEFGIDTRGAVTYTQTIYMARPSAAGAKAFADAVRGWSWQPETIAKIPVFYKLLTRVELRCSSAITRPSTSAPLSDALNDFARSAATGFSGFGLDAAALPAMRAELARRLALPASEGVTPMMVGMAINAASGPDEAEQLLSDARARLPAAAPLRLRAAIDFSLTDIRTNIKRKPVTDYRSALRVLLGDAAYQADPVIAGILRLEIARAGYQKPPPPDAMTLVQSVADDPRLEANDPLKTAALLQLANLQAAARDVVAAGVTFSKTGLSPDQCALLDTPPAIDRTNVNDSDFPDAAQRWGFEGWVRLEQDILADGKATSTRVIIAYPPFVFRDAAVTMGSGIRYRATFRPGSNKGCTGMNQSIKFRLDR